jgi:elongation factor P--beta-lysine ligase
MTQEALKLALEALVTGMEVSIDVSTGDHDSGNRLFGVVDLVQENQRSKHDLILLVQEPKANFKEALAQPEQEPRNVRERWNVELDGNDLLVCFNDHEKGDKCQYERYSPQRTWVGLTSDEISNMFDDWPFKAGEFARAIEAKLKEKNT